MDESTDNSTDIRQDSNKLLKSIFDQITTSLGADDPEMKARCMTRYLLIAGKNNRNVSNLKGNIRKTLIGDSLTMKTFIDLLVNYLGVPDFTIKVEVNATSNETFSEALVVSNRVVIYENEEEGAYDDFDAMTTRLASIEETFSAITIPEIEETDEDEKRDSKQPPNS